MGFSELQGGLILTFAVPFFIYHIFQLKGMLGPLAHNLSSPFLTTSASTYGEADEHDSSFDEGLEVIFVI